jgi:hypothetical protein
MALTFLFQYFNRNSSTSVIHSDATLVGAALENAMFSSGRKTHGIPNRSGKKPFFLNTTPYSLTKMMQIITQTQYSVTLFFNPKFFGSITLSVVKIDIGQLLIFAGGWGQRSASSINSLL